MTISTTRTRPAIPPGASRADGGFTLVELLIGATLSTFILAGVLSAFLMLGRSGMNVASYAVSEAEIRRGVEQFSEDVRMASNITWNSSGSVTLTVPTYYTTATPANTVTYAHDSSASGTTAGCFYRKLGNDSSAAVPLILVRNIQSFTFSRYNRLDGAATNDNETKRVQISMNVRRTGSTLVATNTRLVLASFILRNKVAN